MDDIRFRGTNRNYPTQRSAPRTNNSVRSTPAEVAATSSVEHRRSKTTPTETSEPLIPLDRLKTDKPKKKRTKNKRLRRFGLLSLVILFLLIIGYGGYSYWKSYNPELAKATDTNNNSEALALAIKKKVAMYLQNLPSETPKLQTVTEPNSLGSGFQDTQSGDKILYFESAGKAVIYRPSTGKVVVYTYFTDSSGTGDAGSTSDSTSSKIETPVTNDSSSPLLP